MPLDSGDVTIAPDGTATGDGLAKLIYDALANEHDAFPGQVPAPNTPGAQESLARLARGIAEPIAIAVNEGVEVTADPGEVLGNELDAGSPLVAHPLTPAQLNAIVGSVTLTILQSLIMTERALGATLTAGQGQFYPKNDTPSAPYFRDDTNADRKLLTSPAALSDLASQADTTVLLRALGAGSGPPIAGSATQLNAIVGSAVLTLAQSLILAERAAGATLTAGQGEFFAKNDTPNNPYFRDDTNADRKIATAPVPLTDLATIAVDSFPANVTASPAAAAAKLFTSLVAAATSLAWDATNKRIDYIGSTSNINLSAVSGALGVVDISTLQCGGSVTLQPNNPLNIDGFTAKPDGFWFDLIYRDTSAHICTLNDNVGSTTTSIRSPYNTALNFTQQTVVRMRYQFSRWRAAPEAFGSDLVLRERNAGNTLVAAYGQFFVKDDTPNNPYFRDDTNADRKIATTPVPNADLAQMTAGTVKGQPIGAATGAPVNLSGTQVAALLRYPVLLDTTTTGTITSYNPTGFGADITNIRLTPAGNIIASGMPLAANQEVTIRIGRTAAFTFTMLHEDAGAVSGEAFNTPNNVQLTLRAGDAVTLRGTEGRSNVVGIARGSFDFLKVVERAAGDTLVAGQGEFYAKDDTPNNPYFRDDTNADRKLLTSPAALSDLATAAALSVPGRSANSTGARADIAATASSDAVFRESGGVIGWGTVAAAGLAAGIISPAKLAPVVSNIGAVFAVNVAFAATGVTGTDIDVTIWNAAAPFALKILRADLLVTTAAATAAALRTASAGGGSVLMPDAATPTQTFATAAVGRKTDNAAASASIAAAASVFLRIDRAVAGEVILTCVRT